MFKYFFPCPKQQLTVKGQMELLDLDMLGEARTAMQDCTKVGVHCQLTDLGVGCPHGPGVMLDPFPTEGGQPNPLGWPTGEDGKWAWMEFAWINGAHGKIGWKPDAPPTPEYLRRREQIGGYFVEDAHGQRWAIPTARDRSGSFGKLPTFIQELPNDEWVKSLDQRFAWLWELSKEVWECLDCFYSRGNRPEFTYPWLPKQISRVLGVNYRLGAVERRAFDRMGRGLLTDEFCGNAAEALCDWQVMLDFVARKSQELGDDGNQKKTPSESSPNSPDSTGGEGG